MKKSVKVLDKIEPHWMEGGICKVGDDLHLWPGVILSPHKEIIELSLSLKALNKIKPHWMEGGICIGWR